MTNSATQTGLEVASAIVFVLSSDASFDTGIQLAVDGGWLSADPWVCPAVRCVARLRERCGYLPFHHDFLGRNGKHEIKHRHVLSVDGRRRHRQVRGELLQLPGSSSYPAPPGTDSYSTTWPGRSFPAFLGKAESSLATRGQRSSACQSGAVGGGCRMPRSSGHCRPRREARRPRSSPRWTVKTWSRCSVAIRINALDTVCCYRDLIDVLEGAGDHLDLVMVPKVNRPADVEFVGTLCAQVKQRIGLAPSNSLHSSKQPSG